MEFVGQNATKYILYKQKQYYEHSQVSSKNIKLIKKNKSYYGVNKIVNQEHLQEPIINIYINIYKNINN